MKFFEKWKRNKTWDKYYTREEMELEVPDTSIYGLFAEHVASSCKRVS